GGIPDTGAFRVDMRGGMPYEVLFITECQGLRKWTSMSGRVKGSVACALQCCCRRSSLRTEPINARTRFLKQARSDAAVCYHAERGRRTTARRPGEDLDVGDRG